MGLTQSLNSVASLESCYKILEESNCFYLGKHSYLKNQYTPEILIRKIMTFQNNLEINAFLEAYSKIERTPFNVIYPKAIVKKPNENLCANVKQLHLYFDCFDKNFSQLIEEWDEELVQRPKSREKKIWFILMQLSRSLQILHEARHFHWGISPKTIYCNENGNWFLHDTYFCLGPDYHSFLCTKYENREIISPEVASLLKDNYNVSSNMGSSEDVYSLGFSILSLLTTKRWSDLPHNVKERQLDIEQLFKAIHGVYSNELVLLLKRMLQSDPSHRISISKLRNNIKERESEILKSQKNFMISTNQHIRKKSDQGSSASSHFRQRKSMDSPHIDFKNQSEWTKHSNNWTYNETRITNQPNPWSRFAKGEKKKPVERKKIEKWDKFPNECAKKTSLHTSKLIIHGSQRLKGSKSPSPLLTVREQQRNFFSPQRLSQPL